MSSCYRSLVALCAICSQPLNVAFLDLTNAAIRGVRIRACAILLCNLRCGTPVGTTSWQGCSLPSALRNCLCSPYNRPGVLRTFRARFLIDAPQEKRRKKKKSTPLKRRSAKRARPLLPSNEPTGCTRSRKLRRGKRF